MLWGEGRESQFSFFVQIGPGSLLRICGLGWLWVGGEGEKRFPERQERSSDRLVRPLRETLMQPLEESYTLNPKS